MKRLLAVFVLLVVVALATRFWPQPTPVPSVSPMLRDAFDSMVVARERFQQLLADSSKLDSARVQDSLEAQAVRSADALRAHRLSLRPAGPGNLLTGQPADTARLLTELGLVTQERDLAIQEADSLRVALAHADSAKRSLLATARSLQLAADQYLKSQLWAEGRLDQAIAKAQALEGENVRLRRGCRVPLLGVRCPVVGPGLVLGTDLQPRIGVAIILPL